jgi:hypothetical protein
MMRTSCVPSRRSLGRVRNASFALAFFPSAYPSLRTFPAILTSRLSLLPCLSLSRRALSPSLPPPIHRRPSHSSLRPATARMSAWACARAAEGRVLDESRRPSRSCRCSAGRHPPSAKYLLRGRASGWARSLFAWARAHPDPDWQCSCRGGSSAISHARGASGRRRALLSMS